MANGRGPWVDLEDPTNMPTFLGAYANRLNANERRLLLDASAVVVDEAFEAIERCAEWPQEIQESERLKLFDDTFLANYLPRSFAHRYSLGFFKRFLLALVSVGTKLASGDVVQLSSTAEELAFNAIVESAKIGLEVGTMLDADPERLDIFAEEVLEDRDFEMLFYDEFDGVEKSSIAEDMGVANLSFEQWFTPFRADDVVHPYVVDGSSA